MRTDPVVPDGWWAAGIDGARGLYEVFGRRPASLEGAVCTLMRFDPFPLNLSVVVELADAPDPLPERWRRKGYDAASICLQFLECRDVRSSGALPTGGCSIDVEPVGDKYYILTSRWPQPTIGALNITLRASVLNFLDAIWR